jgi:hypothetical protein
MRARGQRIGIRRSHDIRTTAASPRFFFACPAGALRLTPGLRDTASNRLEAALRPFLGPPSNVNDDIRRAPAKLAQALKSAHG